MVFGIYFGFVFSGVWVVGYIFIRIGVFFDFFFRILRIILEGKSYGLLLTIVRMSKGEKCLLKILL